MEAYQATQGDAMNPQKHTMTVLAQIANWIPDKIVENLARHGNLFNEMCHEAALKKIIALGYLLPLMSRAGHAEADLSTVHTRTGEFVQDE